VSATGDFAQFGGWGYFEVAAELARPGVGNASDGEYDAPRMWPRRGKPRSYQWIG